MNDAPDDVDLDRVWISVAAQVWRRQPRRVPAEQLPQRRVVAGRYPGDQVVVIHRISIAPRHDPVHALLAGETQREASG